MEIRKVAVIGMGTMGARSGLSVPGRASGPRWRMLPKSGYGAEWTVSSLSGYPGKERKMKKEEIDRIHSLLHGTTDLKTALFDAQLAIEAVFEDIESKKNLFTRMDSISPGETIFASNTSTLSITELGAATFRRTDASEPIS